MTLIYVKKGLESYEKLWALTRVELQPNYYTKDKLLKWQEDLRNWYYKDGNGMLLSEHSQKLYHNFQDRLLNKSITSLENDFMTGAPITSKNTDKFLKQDLVKELNKFSSGLRSSLTIDIGGREDPKISYTYGNLKIIEPKMNTNDWSIDTSSDYQRFVVLYTGTKKIDLKDGNAYMIIKDIDNWKHIKLIDDVNLPPILEPNKELTFIWNYGNNINEIFRGS